MVVLGEVLIVVTNHMLRVTPFMMGLLSITMLISVFGIVAMGIGFGALYPNFSYENIAQVSTGFGGVLYMIISTLFMAVVIMLEAGPVYILFMADIRSEPITMMDWLIIIPAFCLVLILQVFAVIKPMRMGVKALSLE
jgi:ABC-2 type transport system permease protein